MKAKALCLFLGSAMTFGTFSQTADYPANYAKEPRFKALLVYNDKAEPAHVEFARDAIEFFHRLTYGEGWIMDVDTSFTNYDYETLKSYNTLIVINTMPESEGSRQAFERYMEEGGGWIGFHASAYNDASTGWPWFNTFLGCGPFYCNNWPPQPVLLSVNETEGPITRNLPTSFVAPESEWYQFNPSPSSNPNVEVLLSISPKNYPLGLKDVVNHGDFPVVWRNRNYRMVYLNYGHGDREFTDATQNLLTLNAFRYVVSQSPDGDPFKK